MTPESTLQALAAPVEELSAVQTVEWLRDALNGQKQLPLSTPDEPRYLGITRLETTLSKETRRDLTRACEQLVQELRSNPAVDDEYLHSLLRLAVSFELSALTPVLAQLAQDHVGTPRLSPNGIKHLLSSIVELGIPQSEDFWLSILNQAPAQCGGLVISGLFAIRPRAALALLPRLPNDQALADAVAIILEQRATKLPAAGRADLLREIASILPRCGSLLQASLTEWLTELNELPRETEPPVRPRTQRSLQLLFSAIKLKQPESPKRRAHTARLVA